MTINYTSLLSLAEPVTGTESGTWGDDVNKGITDYLDIAIAGTNTISTDADVTLTLTSGSSSGNGIVATTAQYAMLLMSGARTAARNVTVPASSRYYIVFNNTTGGYAVTVRGAGPTTGVSVANGEKALVAWNGTDYVKISNTSGAGVFSSITNTGLTSGRVVYSTTGGLETDSANLTFNGTTLTANTLNLTNALGTAYGGTGLTSFTANGVVYASSSSALATGSALTFDGSQVYIKPASGFQPLKISGTGGSIDTFVYVDTAYWAYGDAAGLGGNAFGGNKTNNYLFWQTAGSEQMRLTSTGLGIGTSSPAYKLQVIGASQIQTNAAGTQQVLQLNNSDTTAGTQAVKLGFSSAGTTKSSISVAVYGNDYMTFNVGSDTERMRLDSSGNLGLGVTPSAWGSGVKSYQVGNYTALTNNQGGYTWLSNNAFYDTAWKYLTTNRALYYAQDTADGGHKWYTAPSGTAGDAISFSQAMTLDASGNLGVGTTSPNLAGSGYTNLVLSNATNGGILYVDRPSGARGYFYANATTSVVLGTVGSYPLVFTTNDTERARIDSSGNLLVGATSTSACKVRVTVGGSAAGVRVDGITGANQDFHANRNGSANIQEGPNITLQSVTGTTYATAMQMGPTGETLFFNYNGSAWNERARIDSSGNLLVGTTSSVDSNFKIQLNAPASGVRGVGVNDNGGYGVYLTYDKTGRYGVDAAAIRNVANSPLVFETNNTERARIDSSGNLLVGTTNSDASVGSGFKVLPANNGANNPQIAIVTAASANTTASLSLYSTGAGAYRFYVADGGTIYATSTSITGISDQRLKENIRDLDDGLATVMALKPRKFDWKAGKGKDIKNDRGFIAQEFEQVLPDMVEEWRDPAPEGEEPYKAVNANLIPTLVKAIQEQQALIEQLTKRLAAAGIA
jgi:hypothetical protein